MARGDPPTAELVQRAQRGDPAAFADLCQRYAPRLRRFVRVHLPQNLRRHADSEDVLQDAFLNAVRAFDRFEMRDDDALLHWLATIAANRVRDLAALAGNRNTEPEVSRAASTALLDPASPSDGPGLGAARREEAALVEECLHALDPSHRDLILMRNHLEMGWEAIGASLAISPDAARMRHAAARVALGKALRRLGLEGGPA
jgi:RNA polymerase sigma-70 factor (ECF subfamily)